MSSLIMLLHAGVAWPVSNSERVEVSCWSQAAFKAKPCLRRAYSSIPYALRHSSIVRGLRKGLPIQQVAKLHNTSVKMIERHYAKYIATALEDLARAAVVPRAGGNVVPMGIRA
jgi:hypothetical protein